MPATLLYTPIQLLTNPSPHSDLINAVGNINEVMQIILKEFEYQSSLELESDTYDAISHIPLANKIGVHARQASISSLLALLITTLLIPQWRCRNLLADWSTIKCRNLSCFKRLSNGLIVRLSRK